MAFKPIPNIKSMSKKRFVSIYVKSQLICINYAKKAVRPHSNSHRWIYLRWKCGLRVMRRIKLSGIHQSTKYLGDGILARTIDNVVHRPFAADVIHADELEKTRVDEAHAHAVPHVHGSQVRNDRQRSPEAIRRGEKVEHRCYTWSIIENSDFTFPCQRLCVPIVIQMQNI